MSKYMETIHTQGLNHYLKCCKQYDVIPNPSVAVALQNPWVTHLEVNRKEFTLKDMMTLGEVLIYDTHITTLNLSYCNMDSNCAYVLKKVLAANKTIVKVNLSYNRITKHGAEALGDILKTNKTLTHLKLRNNRLDTKAAIHLAKGLAKNVTLTHLDVSNNAIKVDGINELMNALEERKVSDEDRAAFVFDMDGNYWAEELINSISHGLGILMSLIYGFFLINKASDYSKYPPTYYWSSITFILSLVALYTCSTLAHSFHRMKITGSVLMFMDHACISVLIAGSYTPFCLVTLGHTYTGPILCISLWCLALVAMSLSFLGSKYYKYELTLFVLMGWAAVLPANQLVACMSTSGLALLLIGGLFYTTGIYFFISGQSRPIMHAIWHVFVLLASACHCICIYYYVYPCTL